MAKPRPTITKRTREKAKQEKRQQKADRRVQRDADRQQERVDRSETGGVDPDIAHITPGPQKPLWPED